MRATRPDKHGNLPKTDVDQTCLLCNRNFCEKHKGKEEDVCEVNHETYYRNHRHIPGIFPDLPAFEAAMAAIDAMEDPETEEGLGGG